MKPIWIAWLCIGLPFVAVHAAYWISANSGLVPWCWPYLEGCTSISRAARHGLANLLFKGLMLPYAALLTLFWVLTYAWLRQLRPRAIRQAQLVVGLGTIAAVFLVLYASFLGAEGPEYRWLRRYGITVYFSFTVLAQMFVAALLWSQASLSKSLRMALVMLSGLLLALGLISLPLQHYASDVDAAINALEWTYALLMVAFYPLIASGWAQTGFRLYSRIRPAR